MMFKNNKLISALSTLVIAAFAIHADARPNIGADHLKGTGGQLKTTAASCREASGKIDLDINNVRARLMTGGDMWWDIGVAEARYEVPKNSKKNSLFAGSVWIGGVDNKGQLKVAAQTYRQNGNDYWPGPLDDNANIQTTDCAEWDKFWKLNKSDVNRFRELAEKSSVATDISFETIYTWPAKGNAHAIGANNNNLGLDNATNDYAPFIDVAGATAGSAPDGKYQPENGDYPGYEDRKTKDLPGDQYIWWVYNDKGNTKGESQTEGIGIEVQASAFAYSTKDFLNDATFYNYRLINRSNQGLDSTYIATWTDADLGYYQDDYIGCDTGRGLGILYNGKSVDGAGQTNSYGSKIPMVGIDFFKGPKKPIGIVNGQTVYKELGMESFTYFNNDGTIVGNPTNGAQIYYYMTGSIRNGERFARDFVGPNVNSKAYGAGFPTSRFVFTGDPGVKTEWSECTCNNPVGDRRFVHSSGPFKLEPGVVNDITIGAVWVSDVGGCPVTSFKKIRVADDQAQGLFDNDFQTIEGPEAPRLVARELDRKLVFYLLNDPASNNYKEQYGTGTEAKYRVSSVKAAKYVRTSDSLYKFEGYRVFQLKSNQVQPAQIFNDNGTVNAELAAEVLQTDVKNGVTRLINWAKNTDINDSTFQPTIKVIGVDSGIRHSFEASIDQFAQGNDKRFVNYRSYYFVAVAYAYNNFAPFTPRNADSTQDVTYIESSHGAGGSPIQVVSAMPNPANGDMGTVLNSDYGSGVIIKRLEGTGNGHNSLDLSDESEKEALTGSNGIYQSLTPTYKIGHGPVNVNIVDPVKITPAKWELYLFGDEQADHSDGLDFVKSSWTLINTSNNDAIYSESSSGLSVLNEQIIEKYGLSVNVQQVVRPGIDQTGNNGYISSDILFDNPANPWLAGVNDAENRDFRNWIRSGQDDDTFHACNFKDKAAKYFDTVTQVYERLLSTYSTTIGTWAPYQLGSDENSERCGFGVSKLGTADLGLRDLPSVDVVFTSDKSKWTRCVVFEMEDAKTLAEGGAAKFDLRAHASWDMEVDGDGRPVYSTSGKGMSWFPGYAINQETGERLNIAFGEDSWLKSNNGSDMIWNPTTEVLGEAPFSNPIFGGKHYVYVFNTRYDSSRTFLTALTGGSSSLLRSAFQTIAWVGLPLLNRGYQLKSINDGLIPTNVRLKFRVDRPYAKYVTGFEPSLRNGGFPLYSFSTEDLAPTPVDKNANIDKKALLDRIHVVPNPYYAYAGYENNRLDSRVRINNLPAKATVSIYSLDGALIRRLQKDNANVSYVDWDIRNEKGLPIASGMYLMHVNAEGIGETVLKWFGAMRPLDLTTY